MDRTDITDADLQRDAMNALKIENNDLRDSLRSSEDRAQRWERDVRWITQERDALRGEVKAIMRDRDQWKESVKHLKGGNDSEIERLRDRWSRCDALLRQIREGLVIMAQTDQDSKLALIVRLIDFIHPDEDTEES